MTYYTATLDAVDAALADLTETLTFPLCPVVLLATVQEYEAYARLRDGLIRDGAEGEEG